ncbi:MAG: ABC transporter ATP-binding protein [Alphaproteobacteria bacterium]|jgi:branched-chain amino acid transport system ATP-binding protein|nr:ABC transporter ATP-binding protein [Alphaproteobacteria bacterium]
MTLLVDRLTVTYGASAGLADASFTVAPGEVIALVGANGAGKSSLLKGLMGLATHRAAALTLDGVELGALPTRARIARGFALSPEGRHVFPELTVRQNLDLGHVGGGPVPAERIAAMYRLFPRLQERSGQAAGTMSGGEQQMLAIARAMMANPRVLMLDEPTLGLAPIIVRQIAAFIAAIRATGVAVILAEQNAEMALAAADRGYVVENGRIVLEGRAADLARDPAIKKAFLGI